jgi:hypothetical protein
MTGYIVVYIYREMLVSERLTRVGHAAAPWAHEDHRCRLIFSLSARSVASAFQARFISSARPTVSNAGEHASALPCPADGVSASLFARTTGARGRDTRGSAPTSSRRSFREQPSSTCEHVGEGCAAVGGRLFLAAAPPVTAPPTAPSPRAEELWGSGERAPPRLPSSSHTISGVPRAGGSRARSYSASS